jgi:monoamine oxidase
MSIIEFLRSSSDDKLRPWPRSAIDGLRVFGYTPMMEVSIVEVHCYSFSYLTAQLARDAIGKWWSDEMYTLKHGMIELPLSFIKENKNGWNPNVHLSKDIRFGQTVDRIKVLTDGVEVYTFERAQPWKADYAIITVPLTILQQIKVEPPLPSDVQSAISSIHYEPSTKVFLQFSKQFCKSTLSQS